MQTRHLGSTGFEISRIGFGAWAIGGGGWRFGWGAQDERESIATIHAAFDAGMNWIDTAPVYGVGVSEEVVGRATAGMSERPLIFTKCGLIGSREGEGSVEHLLTAESIRHEVRDSLRRLQVDVIDLYQIHWPVPDADIEVAWQTLVDLQREGTVRAIGVSNFSLEQLQRVEAIAPVQSVQPPLSLVRHHAREQLLPYCSEHDIGVLAYAPLYSGLLSGTMTADTVAALPDDDWRSADPEYREPLLSRNLDLVDALQPMAAAHDCSVAHVAIAWVLAQPGVTAAITGGRHPDHPRDIVRAADVELTASELDAIDRLLPT